LCAKGSNAADKIVFEDNDYVINPKFPHAPNIDVVIHNNSDAAIQRLGIECKFTETYGGRKHTGVAERYLVECANLWEDVPNLKELAQEISPDDKRFTHLHAAQLIKHALALKKSFGKRGFRLLYLWYDAYGSEGAQRVHRLEGYAVPKIRVHESAGRVQGDKDECNAPDIIKSPGRFSSIAI
jgi:hypothetical protein